MIKKSKSHKHSKSLSSQEKKAQRNSKSRSRSREKHHKDRQSKEEHRQNLKTSLKVNDEHRQHFKTSLKIKEELTSYTHYYYLCNDSKHIGESFAMWNLCIKYAQRPSSALIVCQSMRQIANFKRNHYSNRPIYIIDQNTPSPNLQDLLASKHIQIILISQKKCSIIMALQNYSQLFNLIISTGKCYDPQYYVKLTELLLKTGTIITFSDNLKKIKRLTESLEINLNQTQAELSEIQKNRELISDIQFLTKPTTSSTNLVKMLPFPAEEVAARLIQLHKIMSVPASSFHLKMPGYVTYKLDMDVEFNSLKYVWNFIREEFPSSFSEEIRGMQKYQNEKGVVFNVPEEKRYLIEIFENKLIKYKPKYKGIAIEEVTSVLPKLEDTQSEEYKKMKEKKIYAMEHKDQLQIFIAGMPYDMNEVAIRIFFKEKDVNLFLVRILRDEKGFSKGIAFGLCENKQHYERGISLNGTKVGDRAIRVKLADQKKTD